METLEFIIYPDGRVQEKVTGVQGSSCAEVTAALEQQLGIVLKQETTSEYYDSIAVSTGVTQTVSAQGASASSYSEW
jgi:hypothetical protein